MNNKNIHDIDMPVSGVAAPVGGGRNKNRHHVRTGAGRRQCRWSMLSLALFLSFCVCKPVASQKKQEAASEIPIVGWWGIPADESTPERFRELKAAGIGINFSPYPNIQAVEKALDAAQKAGVKVLPYCPELKAEPEKTVRRLMKHPALAGYHLADEPGAGSFPVLAAWVRKIQAVDAHHGCYINLFPNHAPAEALGTATYTEHVEAFLREVPVPFLSFDCYPVLETSGRRSLRDGWYANLEIISATARKAGIPFWAFALATAHNPYPIPTTGELKLQMYSNLAYGAQTLQYFTYWNPDTTTWNFHHAPIDLHGKRTAVYDRIRQVNAEIQHYASVFLGAKVISVEHTGREIPAGTRRLSRLPEQVKKMDTGENGAVVSLLEKGNKRFWVIVNRDFQNPMKLTVIVSDEVKRVLKDGTLVPTGAYSQEYEVDAGDAIIFAINN
ncbi:MAG: beta-galactosidase [Bacteroidales bacterium]|nr:beta-galactosidase [Bacteroidales bacterium]